MNDYLKLMRDVIAQGPYADTWESLCGHPGWRRDAKFGVFIHWGAYAVPAFANEWYPRNMYIRGTPEYEHHIKTYGNHKSFGYKDFIPMFKGEKFDAGEWMSLIRASGAQYVMPVAEHHDGFKMYGSELSAYNAKLMGPRRDVLGELKQAAEREGLVFTLSNHRAEHCWFFNGGLEFDSDVADPANEAFYGKQQAGVGPSTHDIHSQPPSKEHCEDWLAHLVELAEKYRPEAVYLDWWVHNLGFKPYLKQFAAYYYNRAAQFGLDAAIYCKHHAFAPGAAVQDVERGRFRSIRPRAWQTDTSTARNSWCHTLQNEYKDPAAILCDLIDAVSKNGRLLLNIGPRADGVIPDEDRQILLALGKWLERNGEGIYGASCWEVFGEGAEYGGSEADSAPIWRGTADGKKDKGAPIRFTCKGGAIYAFVMRWPEDGEVAVKALKKGRVTSCSGGDFHIREVTALGTDVRVSFKRDGKALRLKAEGPIDDRYPVCVKVLID